MGTARRWRAMRNSGCKRWLQMKMVATIPIQMV